jgi:poly-gamma-glutamate capsule biosynthesis protein CapA/YwtB (metallophosphatase superfamily)
MRRTVIGLALVLVLALAGCLGAESDGRDASVAEVATAQLPAADDGAGADATAGDATDGAREDEDAGGQPADGTSSGDRAPRDDADGVHGAADTPVDVASADGAAEDHAEPGTTPRRFTIAAVGDVMAHMGVVESAAAHGRAVGDEYDFDPMFAAIAPIIGAADLGFCNLETTLSPDNLDVHGGRDRRTASGAPLFHTPWQLARTLSDAGFDVCSTANNHATDAGIAGVRSTLDLLEAHDIASVGTWQDEALAGSPTWLDVAGVRVALLAATYGLNLPLEPADAGMVEVIDLDRLLDQAAQARADGAEFVIVSLHHGIEYQVPISDNQRLRTDTLLASDDVDLLLGHHAHVVQAIERVGDKVAVHGMGNIVSDMKDWETGPDTEDGVVVLLEVVEQADAGRFVVEDVAVVPTWVDRADGHRIVDVGAALAGDHLSGDRRASLERSVQRTLDAIDRKGARTWGAVRTAGTAWFENRQPRSLVPS